MVNLIIGVANSVGISPFLLLSICQVETGIRVLNNYSDGGSYGVAQLQLKTARSIMPKVDILALQQPSVNVTIAAKYLKSLLNKYNNDEWKAIAAYNAGSLRYKNGMLINKKYVDKVKKVYYTYSGNKGVRQ